MFLLLYTVIDLSLFFFAVGRPIPVERCLEPSKQRIDELHAQYCQALKELFEAHKGAFGIAEHVHLNLY